MRTAPAATGRSHAPCGRTGSFVRRRRHRYDDGRFTFNNLVAGKYKVSDALNSGSSGIEVEFDGKNTVDIGNLPVMKDAEVLKEKQKNLPEGEEK